jgi:hypothetical protein
MASWDKRDLVRRVSRVLDFAAEAVRSLPVDGWPEAEDSKSKSSLGGRYQKVVSETALLLACVASVQSVDEQLQERVAHLAARLVPLARSESMLAALCADPGGALQSALAHAVLSRLGFTDPLVDRLLFESATLGNQFRPTLPHDRLEQDWIRRIWRFCPPAVPERGLLARSILGQQLDVLGCTRFDVYSFTHAIMYGTDFGARHPRLPRPASAICADADVALALSLDIDDFDVTAEVTMTWPMLALPWSPSAIFAFGLLINADDRFGFVPGPTFDSKYYESAVAYKRVEHSLATSYHTTYVMGILCAAGLRSRCAPPITVPRASSGAFGLALAGLLEGEAAEPRWRVAFNALGPKQQNAVAPLILTILLRRAKDRGDLCVLRRAVELALAHGLAAGPAVQQAIALLRRSAVLSGVLRAKSSSAGS